MGPRGILDALRVWNDADRRPSEKYAYNAKRARPDRAQNATRTRLERAKKRPERAQNAHRLRSILCAFWTRLGLLPGPTDK